MKKYNLSYLEVSLDFQNKNWNKSKLKDNMWLTAKDLYKNINITFEKIIDIVKSDYRQYSPFIFLNDTKQGDNWDNEKQDLLILDVDDGLTINEAKKIFRKCKYLIATTKSHQMDKKGLKCDRFRIILPAVNIPIGDEYFNFTKTLEKKYPFIDKQVNTKTGAFLGAAKCEYWYNDGTEFDCNILINMQKKLENIKSIKEPTINISKTNTNSTRTKSNHNNDEIDIQALKSRLSRKVIADIISSCGYDVNSKFMFKWRIDERTPSASISKDLLIKDFGSDLCTDIIGFVQQTRGLDFKESLDYVNQYV